VFVGFGDIAITSSLVVGGLRTIALAFGDITELENMLGGGLSRLI